MSVVRHEAAPRPRIETALELVSPLLDLGLVVADRLSRVFGGRERPDRLPARIRLDGQAAARSVNVHDLRR